MGIAERREREKESLRQEILAAASELFAKEGHANLSMRKIAEKIEYSPTTIYLYFRDKTDLLQQVCEDTFAKLIEEVSQIEEMSGEPLECLERGMRTYIDFGLRYPNHYEVTLMMPLTNYDNTGDYEYEGSNGERAFQYIVRQVVRSMEAGSIREADVAATSQAIWASIHGVTALLIGHPRFPFVDREVLIDHVVSTTIKGLKT